MIPERLYKQIHRAIPILCVDLVIVRNGKALLVKRKGKPAAGKFWVPGGRVFKNEPLHLAARRLAIHEVGLAVGPMTFLDYMDCYFEEDPFGHGNGTHTVSLVFRCEIAKKTNRTPRLDENHSDFVWWNGRGERFDMPVSLRKVIEKGLRDEGLGRSVYS